MRYNNIDTSKYSQSLYHLNELIHKYGQQEILEYDEDMHWGYPEIACVVVASIMEDLGLVNLIEWKNWWKMCKHHREDLTIEQLTIIIYQAMAEFKQSYLDLMVPDNASDEKKLVMMKALLEKDREFIRLLNPDSDEIPEAYDYTIRPEDLKKACYPLNLDLGRSLLKEIGLKKICTTEDVDEILWRLAFMGYDMSIAFRNAMVELTSSRELIEYIDFKYHQYNHVIGNQKEIRVNYKIEELKSKYQRARNTILQLENKIRQTD